MMRRRSSVDLETKTYQRDQVLRDRRSLRETQYQIFTPIEPITLRRSVTLLVYLFAQDGKRASRQSFSFRKLNQSLTV
ncbi:LOW QUALITY PROTEIN: hypothetical protein KUTeg_020522 [Tegillarca granosa]|uniref:Uncharacterized protein n=1 Tax=Tegillarca granosa TaxID=220873 RepID=A0ABQ9E8M6_TEGGR|nr:LOW QUALITY PROTEIN: hypothetical protein KUTeg_020522 [Tegillarca granosa]